jgi:hypothetical protein
MDFGAPAVELSGELIESQRAGVPLRRRSRELIRSDGA